MIRVSRVLLKIRVVQISSGTHLVRSLLKINLNQKQIYCHVYVSIINVTFTTPFCDLEVLHLEENFKVNTFSETMKGSRNKSITNK